MKRKIYSEALLQNYRKNFVNQLSKFIHGNFLKPEDLDKQLILNGLSVTVVGLNDDKQVVLKENNSKNIYVADTKEVKEILDAAEPQITSEPTIEE